MLCDIKYYLEGRECIMVDTIELYMELENSRSYNEVFVAINDFAEEVNGNGLHKSKKYESKHAKKYVTGTFGKEYGVLEAGVVRYKGIARKSRLVIKYKPAKVLKPENIYAL